MLMHPFLLSIMGFDWGAFDYSLLIGLLGLLGASGFFSGSETALFGMSQSERGGLDQNGVGSDRAVLSLLGDPHMLLITVMLGNMTVNALYFVIGSVLMMDSGWGGLGQLGLGLGFLMTIVLFGEVLPKMVATGNRLDFARRTGPWLLGLHRIIAPVRIALSRLVVRPLGRLASPSAAPSGLEEEELLALLDLSEKRGVIDEEEERILREVFALSRLRVRDVMTPRVRVRAVSEDAGPEEVKRILVEQRLTKLPVYRDDLDTILGILHTKRYLLESYGSTVTAAMTPARYVPQMASLEQLLHEFQSTDSQCAIVVDEYGGTAGFVSLEDVVEELVGDIARGDGFIHSPRIVTQIVGLNQWRLDGEMSVHDWAEQFELGPISTPVSTVGGLILHELGRGAAVGDEVNFERITLRVQEMDGARIIAVLIIVNSPAAKGPGRDAH